MLTFWNGVPAGKLSSNVAEPVNYPNPFSKSTQITFEVPTTGVVNIAIYDVMGRMIQELRNGFMNAGTYTLPYDAANMISNGKYMLVLQSGSQTITHTMTVVK